MRHRIAGIDVEPLGRCIGAADQRLSQTMRMGDVVETEAALDAKPVLVGGASDPLHPGDLVVLDLEGELAANTAIGAYAVNLAVKCGAIACTPSIEHRSGHQRAGRAGLHAFATGHASRLSHRVIEVEGDLRVMPAAGHANDIVDLHFAAGTDAEIAMNAGVEIYAHGQMRGIKQWHALALDGGKAAFGDILEVRHGPEMR